MENKAKISWRWCFKLCLLLILLVSRATTIVFAEITTLNYPLPTVSISGRVSNYTFKWVSVSEVKFYEMPHTKVKDEAANSVVNTNNANVFFSKQPLSVCNFYFTTAFEEKTSDYVIEDDLIML